MENSAENQSSEVNPKTEIAEDLNSTTDEDSSNNEQTRLKEAMMEWKQKGNTRLADACADALGINDKDSEETSESPDSEYTNQLKKEVERLEAEAEWEKKKQSNPEKVNSYVKSNSTGSNESESQNQYDIVKGSASVTNIIESQKVGERINQIMPKRLKETKFTFKIFEAIIYFELFRLMVSLFMAF